MHQRLLVNAEEMKRFRNVMRSRVSRIVEGYASSLRFLNSLERKSKLREKLH